MLIFQYECLPYNSRSRGGRRPERAGAAGDQQDGGGQETSAHRVIRHSSLRAAPIAVPVSTHRLGNELRSRQRQSGTEESDTKYCFKTPLDVSIKHT